MKEASGTLSIEILLECPYCESCIDLFEIDSLQDDGYVYSVILGGDTFGIKDWNEVIECPCCNKDFKIIDIDW